MTARSLIDRIVQQEDINFFLTNRIPRRRLTQLMGWLSRIEQPWLCRVGILLWRVFTDLDLGEAEEARFSSLHACFTRRLKQGARPIDGDAAHLASPCDALIGACGRVGEGTVLQANGSPYALADLVCDAELAQYYRGGEFATLRLTSSMYHRFHAPYDCRVEQIDYISGDTWNVNPIALKRVERLFCKNERAVIELDTGSPDEALTLVPVASILVASLKVHAVDQALDLRHEGRKAMPCDVAFEKGQELGYFESGSTIIVLASGTLALDPSVREGDVVRVGMPLFRRTSDTTRVRS
jgi:phosphatidylserine decarboxylase